jgi:hypothetical protein
MQYPGYHRRKALDPADGLTHKTRMTTRSIPATCISR